MTYSQGMMLVGIGFIAFIGLYLWWDSRAMRRRRRYAKACQEYIKKIDEQASWIERACFWRKP